MNLDNSYNVYSMINHYQENQDLIHAHIRGDADTMQNTTILNMGIGAFFALFLLVIIMWIAALYLLIKHWNSIPDWAKVVGVLSFVMGVPIITIIVVIASKDGGLSSQSDAPMKSMPPSMQSAAPSMPPPPAYSFNKPSINGPFKFQRL